MLLTGRGSTSRCEEVPDDGDVFWVSGAADRGSLTVEQTEELFAALERALDGDSTVNCSVRQCDNDLSAFVPLR